MRNLQWRKLFNEKNDHLHEQNENMVIMPNLPNPFEVFNKNRFWVADLNFKISKAEFAYLNHIEGVESANYLSPYKIVILVGELFDESSVKNVIYQELCNKNTLIEEPQTNENDELFLNPDFLQELEKAQNYKNWVVYLLPNGKIISELSDSDIDTTQYIEAYSLVGGALLTSYDFRTSL